MVVYVESRSILVLRTATGDAKAPAASTRRPGIALEIETQTACADNTCGVKYTAMHMYWMGVFVRLQNTWLIATIVGLFCCGPDTFMQNSYGLEQGGNKNQALIMRVENSC